MILGLFIEMMMPGGIQRIGQHTASILASFARDRGIPCRLLSLNDPLGQHELTVGDITFTIQGFKRRKIQFVLSVLAAALRTRLAYIGHPNLASLGLLLRLLRPSARYWVATYGIDVWEPMPLLRRLGLRLAYAVIALSKFTSEKMAVAQKLNPGKITVLPPALDPGFLRTDGAVTRPKPPIPSGKVLLTVARLAASEQYKGMETVVRALPTVLKVVPDTYYVVVGDGNDRLQLERLAQQIGVAGHVLFTGVKIGDELASYYEACDIFVMPSRKEGFGVVFLEAMACSKPVIGGNHGGTPEVVIDGATGFLVEYGDVNALADRIIRLLHDPKLCRRIGEAGRRRVEENYTFEHFRRRLVQLLTGGNPCVS